MSYQHMPYPVETACFLSKPAMPPSPMQVNADATDKDAMDAREAAHGSCCHGLVHAYFLHGM